MPNWAVKDDPNRPSRIQSKLLLGSGPPVCSLARTSHEWQPQKATQDTHACKQNKHPYRHNTYRHKVGKHGWHVVVDCRQLMMTPSGKSCSLWRRASDEQLLGATLLHMRMYVHTYIHTYIGAYRTTYASCKTVPDILHTGAMFLWGSGGVGFLWLSLTA